MNIANDIKSCLEVLQTGGLILYPTDTVWGIGCDATNAAAVAKIFKLKLREDAKSLIALIADESWLKTYTAIDRLPVSENQKKPVTVVYPGAKNVAQNLISADGTVALRVPRDAFCQKLLDTFKKPIVSTSANFAGAETPRFFSEIDAQIKESISYVVKHRQTDETIAAPSTIARLTAEGTLQILRS